MKRLLFAILIICFLIVPVGAMEFTAPTIPDSGKDFLPEEPDTFSEGLWMVIKEAAALFQPSIREAAGSCMAVIASSILCAVIKSFAPGFDRGVALVGTLFAGSVLLRPSNALISLAADTVMELSNYGKLLFPVMTAALAAQGGVSASTALYTGTIAFDAVLSALIASVIVPMIYIFIALAVASGAIGDDTLKKLKDFVKWLITWALKIVLYVFTGYMGITGVVSGTADAAAVKATKLTISGMVPVVGSILSDASEAVLISAGVMKSAVGVYGLLAFIAIWIGPFIKIGVQYLLMKVTCTVCEIFTDGAINKLVKDLSSALGLLLAMTGTVCLLLLISVVCFMRGTM